MKRIFYVDQVRNLISQYEKKEISLSKLVEILNEKATGKTAIELYKAEVQEKEHEKMGCPFRYCDSTPKCIKICRHA